MNKNLNRSLLIFLSMVLVLSSITVMPITTMAAEPLVVYSEDFESDKFTLETNIDNNVKELKKDDQTVLTFVKKPGATFDQTFPQTTEELIRVDGGTNTPINATKAVYTGSYLLGKNTEAYLNFPQVYKRGLVSVEFRVRRTSQSTTNFYTFYSDNIEGYAPKTDKAYQLEYFVNSTSKSRFRGKGHYVNELTRSDDGYHDTSNAKGWPWMKLDFDLGGKTVTTSYKTSATGSYTTIGSQKAFYANGSGTTDAPYYTNVGLGGFSISGDSFATLDDFTITYTDSENAPTVSNLKFDGAMTVGTTLKATYDYNDTEGDVEKGSIVTWERCPDDEFTTHVQIIKSVPVESEDSLNYTITGNDVGYYISVSVKPMNQAEVNPSGIEQEYRSSEAARIPQTVPMVNMISPVDGESIPIGEKVILSAEAKCDNTTITKVEYYVDDQLVASSNTAPFDAEYQFDTTGSFSIYAKAYNALGENADSGKIDFEVTPVTSLAVYKDGVSEEVTTSIFGASTLSAKASLINKSTEAISVVTLLALYNDDNKLLSLSASDNVHIEPGESKDAIAELTLEREVTDAASIVKAFVWNADSLVQYCSSVTYQVTANTSGLSDMDIYLILGQSNASGRASIPSDCKATLDNVYLMNRSYEWEGAKNSFNRYNNVGEPYYKYDGNMNFGYPFAKMITQYIPDRNIGIINNAIGGTSLNQWEKGSKDGYYEKTMLMVNEALKYGNVKGILWHLGSSDMGKGYTRDEYITKLNNFANSFRTDIGDMTIPFVVGELAPTSDQRIEFNKVFMSINKGDIHVDYSWCVSAEGAVTADGSHFTSGETKLMGRRYADAILNMIYDIDVPDDVVDNISYTSTKENLALNATASASSTNASSTYNISFINDGSTDTGWVVGEYDGMNYCMLDLGDAYTIDQIRIASRTNYNNENDRKNFKILVSNDPTFTEYKVFGTRGGIAYNYRESWDWFSIDSNKYRYVKVVKTADEGLGISELSVFGY
ncbi:MAG: sialate O-acetylesterase [Eubacteriales bacterium]|nr:sialate O-acetylesterase [Eubacteriales bacterium]